MKTIPFFWRGLMGATTATVVLGLSRKQERFVLPFEICKLSWNK